MIQILFYLIGLGIAIWVGMLTLMLIVSMFIGACGIIVCFFKCII